MAEATLTRKERVRAGLTGLTTAFVAWPILAVAVLFVVIGFGDGWQVLGLLAIGLYGWVAISLAAAVIAAYAGGPVNQVVRGALTVVGIAIGLYLAAGLLVAFA